MSAALFLLFDATSLTLGLGYPIWRSYKVVEAKKFDHELIQWLSFWIIHAALNKLEDAISFIYEPITGNYLYRLIKLLFILWMIHPRYQGALYAYFVYVEKYFRKNEEKMRRSAGRWLTTIPNHIRVALNAALTYLAKQAGKGKKASYLERQARSASALNTGITEIGAYDEMGINQAPQTVEQLSRTLTKRLEARQRVLRQGTVHLKQDYLDVPKEPQ